ncbi:MAG: hypothetical protein HONBIEJF_02450 [Fimbriimonadaceae bacterium]|nr:hypothetical protein [Fimbriimonadaceae bacterium]
MYSTDPRATKFGAPWRQVNWDEMTYDEASDLLTEYETDFRQFENENREGLRDWWNEGRRDIQRQMAEMREKLDSIQENAPDAWGEMKDAFAGAMSELSEGYHRTVRELRKKV